MWLVVKNLDKKAALESSTNLTIIKMLSTLSYYQVLLQNHQALCSTETDFLVANSYLCFEILYTHTHTHTHTHTQFWKCI